MVKPSVAKLKMVKLIINKINMVKTNQWSNILHLNQLCIN